MDGIWQAIGGLGLFLLGMKTLTRGLEAIAGRAVRRILARFTRSPSSGAMTGAAMTALVQSSSVTTVAAVGFVGAGLLTFPQALGVIFGANAGTTLTGWVVALVGFKLDLGAALIPLVFPAVLLHLMARRRVAGIGLAICGLALVFLGLDFLKLGLAGLQDVVTPAVLPGDSFGGRLALVGIGALITLVTQSSSAGVATAIVAVHSGSIGLSQATAMVIGMDVGTTATAVLATIGASTQARRTGYAHVIYNLLTAVFAFALLPLYIEALGPKVEEAEFALVGFHTLFNCAGVIGVLPFAQKFAELMIRIVPEREQAWVPRLTPALLERPASALDAISGSLRALVHATAHDIADGLESPKKWEDSKRALSEKSQAVHALQRSLDKIRFPSLGDNEQLRLRRLLLVLDHLMRLLNRCQRYERSTSTHDDPTLAKIEPRIVSCFREAPHPPEGSFEQRIENLYSELCAGDKTFRREVVGQSALASLEVEQALSRMDDFRFFHRLVHHLWRIFHHFRAADTQRPLTTDEGEADWEA